MAYNTSIEDDKFFDPWPESGGHAPEPINHQTLRVILKNLNGIKPKKSNECNKLDTRLLEWANLDARLLLINEHNSGTKQLKVRDGFKHKLMRHWITHRSVFSSSIILVLNTYLPGGTLIVILGRWTGRFLTFKVDPTQMGRWSYISRLCPTIQDIN